MKDIRYSGWLMPEKAASFTKELLMDAVSPPGGVMAVQLRRCEVV